MIGFHGFEHDVRSNCEVGTFTVTVVIYFQRHFNRFEYPRLSLAEINRTGTSVKGPVFLQVFS